MRKFLLNIIFIILIAVGIVFTYQYTQSDANYAANTYVEGVDISYQEKSDATFQKIYNDFFNTTKVVFIYNGVEVDSSKSYVSFDLDTTKEVFNEGSNNDIYCKISLYSLNSELEYAFAEISVLDFDDVSLGNEIRQDLFTDDNYLVYDLTKYIETVNPQETYELLASFNITENKLADETFSAEKIYSITGGSIVIPANNRYYLLEDIDSAELGSYDYSLLASAITKLTIEENFVSYLKHNPYKLESELPTTLSKYWSYVSRAQDVDFSFYNNSDNIYIIKITRNGSTLYFDLYGAPENNNIKIITDVSRVNYDDIYDSSTNTDDYYVYNGYIYEFYRGYLDEDGKEYKRVYLFTNYFRPTRELKDI